MKAPTWLIRRLAPRLIAAAHSTPYLHLDGYMNRFWLFRIGSWGTADNDATEDGVRPFLAARVHEILRSDQDRSPHDHPWPYLTIILTGGYFETRINRDGTGPERVRWHGPGSVLLRRAADPHYLTVPVHDGGSPCVTLFIMGPQVRKWGFWSEHGWVYWRHYLGMGGPFDGQLPPFRTQVRAWFVQRLQRLFAAREG